MDGIVLINKPIGITTYDVVRRAKKVFKTKKIGHTGTLDPFASGLVILCINKATKLVTNLILSDKTYEGTILFNHFYDTYDFTGKLLEERNEYIDLDEVKTASKSFIGKYMQMPPKYSAIRVDGKRLYEYARENKEVKINKREVEIYDFDILDKLNKNEITFKTHVSKGTYIRSLAFDLAKSIDKIATLSSLTRTKIDKYMLKDAYNFDDFTKDSLITIEEIYNNHQKVVLNDYLIKLVKNGIYLDERQIKTDEDFLVYDTNNNLVALYQVIDKFKYKPLIIF